MGFLDNIKYMIGDKVRERQIAAAEGGTKQKGGKHARGKGPVLCKAKKTHTIKGSKHIHHECMFVPDPDNPAGECGKQHLCRHWEIGCDYRWS